MLPAPSRVLQIACATVAIVGFAPWANMFAGTVLNAIESKSPLMMSVAAWLVLLIPGWVIWFAVIAWRERNVSARPAVLMAIPAALLTMLVIAIPYVRFAP